MYSMMKVTVVMMILVMINNDDEDEKVCTAIANKLAYSNTLEFTK